MRYFLTTKFNERGINYPIEMISIGIVAEDGREFYAIDSSFDHSHANGFVQSHVLPHVTFNDEMFPRPRWEEPCVMTRQQIKQELVAFLTDESDPEFWANFASYDWVVFCQIFGTMNDLPVGFSMYCNDIQQLRMIKGNPRIPDRPLLAGITEYHHSLYDAREVQRKYQWLMRQPNLVNVFCPYLE